jgi:hypothetical protein
VSFLEAIQDPNHEEHKMYLEWVGGKFDPDAFDLEKINASLRSLKSSKSKETSDPQSFEIPKSEMIKFDKAFSWLETLTDDEKQVAENLPLRRDMVSLLTYLRENKVIGTQSTGNFPLKAVKEITAHFVNPPELEETLGEHVYKVHSESEVWPLFSLHMQASIGGFVSINQGRRWELTQSGERFLEKPAPFQVWFLNLIWWKEANWVVASPFSYQDGFLPDGFSKLVCANLLEIAPNEAVSFETFADGIIKVAGLVWPIRDPDNSRRILHGFVEFAVIKSLADYGILRVDYEPSEKLGGDYRDMVSFQVTAFGKGLLETLQELLS